MAGGRGERPPPVRIEAGFATSMALRIQQRQHDQEIELPPRTKEYPGGSRQVFERQANQADEHESRETAREHQNQRAEHLPFLPPA